MLGLDQSGFCSIFIAEKEYQIHWNVVICKLKLRIVQEDGVLWSKAMGSHRNMCWCIHNVDLMSFITLGHVPKEIQKKFGQFLCYGDPGCVERNPNG